MVTTKLTLRRGDSWTAALYELGNLTGFDALYFTCKNNFDDTDVQARVLIDEATGLLVLNGAAATAGWGSMTIDNLALGNVTLELEPEATELLVPNTLCYDFQAVIGGVVTTLAMSTITISDDVTRAIT